MIFTSPVLAGFLPRTFGADALHRLCEIILRRPCDPAMPADRLLAMGLIERVAPRPDDTGARYRFVAGGVRG